jgi:hypothetical protein
MQQTENIAVGAVRQVSYLCPVCDCHHIHTQPCETRLRRVGNRQRCSSGWPDPGLVLHG